jgi:AraC-like DNA-binding protein
MTAAPVPMLQEPRHLLDGHPVIRECDGDELAAYLRTKGYRLWLSGPPRPYVNVARLPSLYVSFVRYGVGAVADIGPERGDYALQTPLRGSIATRTGGQEVTCDSRWAVIGSPSREQRTQMTETSERILVSFDAAALTRQLAALLGEAVGETLVFAPALDVDAGPGRSLMRSMRLAIEEIEEVGSLLANRVAATQFEQWLMTALLLAQPSNYSARLQGGKAPAPRDVKRAIEYIRSHLDSPITIDDLVAATGVPGRTLYQHFRDFEGLTPFGYVKKLRFERVRAALLEGDEITVTEAASRWGFEHLGRFAIEYRRRFGETPSATLGRARRRLS